MLREIPFYAVLLIEWSFPLVAIMWVVALVGKLTEKPKAPPYVPTPEDTRRALANIAKFEAMRQANAQNH